MLTRFVLVPRPILTQRNISISMLQQPYLALQILKFSGVVTCLYMPISRRQCTLLCVLNFHRNSIFDLSVFSLVTPANRHNCPVHSCYEFLWWTLVLLHVQVIVFDPLCFAGVCLPFALPTLYYVCQCFYPCRDPRDLLSTWKSVGMHQTMLFYYLLSMTAKKFISK